MTKYSTTAIFLAAMAVAVISGVVGTPARLMAAPSPAQPPAPPRAFIWRATTDFTAVDDPALARAYLETKAADSSLHGFAVDPIQFQDRFAAAEFRFNGPVATYTLVLLAVAEEDGESVYRLAINGVDLAARVNPASAEKPEPRPPSLERHHTAGGRPG